MVNGVLCLRVPNPQFVIVLLQQELSGETWQNKGKEKQRQKSFYVYYTPGLEFHLQLTEKSGGLLGWSQLLTLSSRVWCGRRNAWYVQSHFIYTFNWGFTACGWPEWQGLVFGAQSTIGWLINNLGEVNPGFHLRVVWCRAIQVTFTRKQKKEKKSMFFFMNGACNISRCNSPGFILHSRFTTGRGIPRLSSGSNWWVFESICGEWSWWACSIRVALFHRPWWESWWLKILIRILWSIYRRAVNARHGFFRKHG